MLNYRRSRMAWNINENAIIMKEKLNYLSTNVYCTQI